MKTRYFRTGEHIFVADSENATGKSAALEHTQGTPLQLQQRVGFRRFTVDVYNFDHMSGNWCFLGDPMSLSNVSRKAPYGAEQSNTSPQARVSQYHAAGSFEIWEGDS